MNRLWTGGNGDWNSAANWTPAGVPQAGDAAVINPNPTVYGEGDTITASAISVGSLTFDPGFDTLAVSGPFQAATAVYQAGDSVVFAHDTTLNGFAYDLGERIGPLLNEGATLGSAGALTLGANLHLAVDAFQLPGNFANGQVGRAFLYSQTVLTNDGAIVAAYQPAAPGDVAYLGIDQGTSGIGSGNPAFVNNGSLDVSGAVQANIDAMTVVNRGSLSVGGTGRIDLGASALSQSSTGEVRAASGGIFSWDNSAAVAGGAVVVDRGGTMQVAGSSQPASGASVVFASSVHLVNDGTIGVGDNASLRIEGLLGGAGGSTTLGTGSTLELANASAYETVTFTGNVGALVIDGGADGSGYALDAAISGFASGQPGFANTIDLKSVKANGAHWSNGTLQLTENNVGVAKLHLLGDYGGASFQVAADGTGGSRVSLAALLRQPATPQPPITTDFDPAGLHHGATTPHEGPVGAFSYPLAIVSAASVFLAHAGGGGA